MFELANHIRIQRLGQRAAAREPEKLAMFDVMAVMAGVTSSQDMAPDARA